MDQSRDELLSGSSLALDEHRKSALRSLADLVDQAFVSGEERAPVGERQCLRSSARAAPRFVSGSDLRDGIDSAAAHAREGLVHTAPLRFELGSL
jgi:hypothetical protein